MTAKSWRDVVLYLTDDGRQVNAADSPDFLLFALREFRKSGSMPGAYFTRAAAVCGPDEDADALDGDAPEIDWTGFPEPRQAAQFVALSHGRTAQIPRGWLSTWGGLEPEDQDWRHGRTRYVLPDGSVLIEEGPMIYEECKRFYIVPNADREDIWAAGDGNGFDTEEEALDAIPGLVAVIRKGAQGHEDPGQSDDYWTVAQRRSFSGIR